MVMSAYLQCRNDNYSELNIFQLLDAQSSWFLWILFIFRKFISIHNWTPIKDLQLGRNFQKFNSNPGLWCADFNMWGVLSKNSNLKVQWLTEKAVRSCIPTIMQLHHHGNMCHFGQCWPVLIRELCRSIFFIQGEQYPSINVTCNRCCAQPQVEL